MKRINREAMASLALLLLGWIVGQLSVVHRNPASQTDAWSLSNEAALDIPAPEKNLAPPLRVAVNENGDRQKELILNDLLRVLPLESPTTTPSPSPSPTDIDPNQKSKQDHDKNRFEVLSSSQKAKKRHWYWKGLVAVGLDRTGNRIAMNVTCDDYTGCPFVDEVADALRKNVEKAIEQMYQGKQPDLNGGESSDAATEVPICNRGKDSDSGELAQNHLGQKCGNDYCHLKKCEVPGAGNILIEQKSCENERAWARGALIQGAKSALEDILKDYTQNGTLWVGQRCSGMVSDPSFSDMVTAFNSLYDEVMTSKGNKVITCDISSDQPFSNPAAYDSYYRNDRRTPEQSGCYLNAALMGLQGMMVQTAACEVFARADIEWNNKTLPRAQSAIVRSVDLAKSECGPAGSESCLNQAYKNRITKEWDTSRESTPSGDFNLTCPDGAKDCKATCGNPAFCGSGSPFSRVQLASINRAVQYGYFIKNDLKLIQAFSSDRLAYAIGSRSALRWGDEYSCSAESGK